MTAKTGMKTATMGKSCQAKNRGTAAGSGLVARLALSLVVAFAPLALAGCGGPGVNVAAAPAVPTLHSAATGFAAAAPDPSPAPVASAAPVVATRFATGTTVPTGNLAVSVQFPQQTNRVVAPRQQLALVPASDQQ